jgi:hypothetical protein
MCDVMLHSLILKQDALLLIRSSVGLSLGGMTHFKLGYLTHLKTCGGFKIASVDAETDQILGRATRGIREGDDEWQSRAGLFPALAKNQDASLIRCKLVNGR